MFNIVGERGSESTEICLRSSSCNESILGIIGNPKHENNAGIYSREPRVCPVKNANLNLERHRFAKSSFYRLFYIALVALKYRS